MAVRSAGSSAFTVASVPTAMKAGVSTGPCGVVNVPVRARASVACTVNAKATYRTSSANAALSAQS
jgi:hypothetical protein